MICNADDSHKLAFQMRYFVHRSTHIRVYMHKPTEATPMQSRPKKREITGNVYSEVLASGYTVNKKTRAGAKRYNDIKLSPIYVDYGASHKPASTMAT